MKYKLSFEDWCLINGKEQLLQYYKLGENQQPACEIGCSSSQEISLKCPTCHEKWTINPNHLTRPGRNDDCPFCNHRKASRLYNLADSYPELIHYWDTSLNTSSPEAYTPQSHATVHWRCEQGHTWAIPVRDQVKSTDRYRKRGGLLCPFCSGQRVSATYNLEVTFPQVAYQWNYIKNEGKKPCEVHPFSQQNVWWTCEFDPAHVWQDRISNRTALLRGCPKCSRHFHISYASRAVYYYLAKFYPGCACEVPFGSRYLLDILLPEEKIVIEHDGHYYHSSPSATARAGKKDRALLKEGYRIIRLCDSKEHTSGILYENDVITYPWDERNGALDQAIAYLVSLLSGKQITPDHRRDHWEIERKYYHERKKRSLAVRYPDLAKEWSVHNKHTPDTILTGSSQKVLWTCPNCRRDYPASVANRTQHGSQCPFCSNTRVCEDNSLAVLMPQIAKEWNWEKNAPLTPRDVMPGTEKKVWWNCKKGHTWPAMIYSRTGPGKSGCPYCSHNKVSPETSLSALNPALADLWDTEKNNGLEPWEVTLCSNIPVWWRCSKGHSWQLSPNMLQKCKPQSRCPYCNNRKVCPDNCLATVHPQLAKEWHPVKNGGLTPYQITAVSTKRVWWQCKEGHEWEASVSYRNQGHGCSACLKAKKKVL